MLYRKYIKRFLDILISGTALLIAWPILAVIAVLVRIKLGKPVLFVQDRPGYKGKIFKLYKFRSMTDQRDAEGKLLPAKERTTKFGSALRSTSLDELPEVFINVLNGSMSLIGPRPLATQYLPYYSKEEMRRHDVRPGLTGLAQLNGRNNLAWEERFRYDVEYVDKLSFGLDVKILFMTVMKVLKRSDVADTRQHIEENFDTYRKRQIAEGSFVPADEENKQPI